MVYNIYCLLYLLISFSASSCLHSRRLPRQNVACIHSNLYILGDCPAKMLHVFIPTCTVQGGPAPYAISKAGLTITVRSAFSFKTECASMSFVTSVARKKSKTDAKRTVMAFDTGQFQYDLSIRYNYGNNRTAITSTLYKRMPAQLGRNCLN